jgi:hypothetical protein
MLAIAFRFADASHCRRLPPFHFFTPFSLLIADIFQLFTPPPLMLAFATAYADRVSSLIGR